MPTASDAFAAYPALAGLPPTLRAEVERSAIPFAVPAGAVLFDVGSESSGFVLVLEGAVEVSRPAPNGREILLYRLAPGDACVMTLTALLGRATYEGRATTTAPTRGLIVPPPLFDRMLAEAPAFRSQVLGLLAGRLHRVVAVLEATAFEPVEQRLARELLARGPLVQATHQQLADAVGSVREVASRRLSAWAKDGLVESGRGTVRILDREALARIAEPLGSL